MNTVRVVDNARDFDSEPNKFDEEFVPSTSASIQSPLLCPCRGLKVFAGQRLFYSCLG